MSTRATYRFVDQHCDVTFYIHHDGYPEGAASYFYAMVKMLPRMETYNHGLAEVFFRANPRAEFTRCHESHSDTEYRYTMSPSKSPKAIPEVGIRLAPSGLVVEEGYGRLWRTTFEGSVEDFISIHIGSI